MGSTDPMLKEILDAVKSVRAELTEFKNESNENFGALSTELQGINEYKIATDKRLDDCELNISHLAYEMECIKQRQLKCNISISGIPVTANENLLDIFNSICTAINFNCTNENVAGIYRTTGRTKQSIIVQLSNESIKFGIINAKKLKKSLIIEELSLNFNNATNEVMVNQQLTPYFGNLLYNARQAKHHGHIAECWFSMKGVHIKPTKNSNAVIIKSACELNAFIPTETPIDSNANQNTQTSNEAANKRKASQDISNDAKKTTEAPTPKSNNKKPNNQPLPAQKIGTTPNLNKPAANIASGSGAQTATDKKK